MQRFFKLIVVLAAVGVMAAVAYNRGRPHREVRHPLVVEIGRLHADAARLYADVCAGIDSLDSATGTLRESLNAVDERVADIQRRAEQAQVKLTQTQQTLDKYAPLAARNEGVILPDRQYVSPHVVREQYDFERDHRDVLREKLALLIEHRANAERLQLATQERYQKTNTTLAKLCQARDQLQEQLAHLELLMQTFSEDGLVEATFQSDVRRLQDEITSMQDQLDVYLRELPDTIALERGQPTEILLPR